MRDTVCTINKLVLLLFFLTLLGCASTKKEASNTVETNKTAQKDYTSNIDRLPVLADFKEIVVSLPVMANNHLFSLKRFKKDGRYLDKINLSGQLLFDVDTHKVKNQSKTTLTALTNHYRSQFNDNYIFVVGHTDSDGNEAHNMGLSSRRAMAVIEVLEQLDIEAKRLYVIPAGEHLPEKPNSNRNNKALNRRVEIYLSKSAGLTLEYLRSVGCPDKRCTYARVSIIPVDKRFLLSNQKRDEQIPNSVLLMEDEFKERSVNSDSSIRVLNLPMVIRNIDLPVIIREVQNYPPRYFIKSNDKRRLRLADEL